MIALTLACAPGATASTSTVAGSGSPRMGVVTDLTWGVSHATVDQTVSRLRTAGAGWVRMNVSWSGAQPDGPTTYNTGWLADIDYAVRAARGAGLRVLMPIADGVPYWASADPNKRTVDGQRSWNKMWRPSSMAAYGGFVGYLVSRYAPLSVTAFEIWNEPNLSRFWPSGPSAAAYVPMLRAGYEAVKRAAPGATVVLGGLSKNDASYLAGVYAAGGRPYFDVAAVHPYTGAVSPATCWNDATGRRAKDAFCGIQSVRSVMVANGDAAKSLWLTEMGWSTTTGAYGVTETQQAAFLSEAYKQIAAMPYVTNSFVYTFRNIYWLKDDASSWQANAGLLRTTFTAKPALASFTAAAKASP